MEGDMKRYHMEQCRTAWSFVCVPQHGSVSLIDILDTVAPPLSPHILALTPSAPWINSLLAHEQRQDSWSGHFHFLRFFFLKKRSQNRIQVGMRSQDVALTHSASHQQSQPITGVNRNETGPRCLDGVVRLGIMLPGNQISSTLLL